MPPVADENNNKHEVRPLMVNNGNNDNDNDYDDEKYAAKPSYFTGCCTTKRIALALTIVLAFGFFYSLGSSGNGKNGSGRGDPGNHEIHQTIHVTTTKTASDTKTMPPTPTSKRVGGDGDGNSDKRRPVDDAVSPRKKDNDDNKDQDEQPPPQTTTNVEKKKKDTSDAGSDNKVNDVSNMLLRFRTSREALYNKLRNDYGPTNFEKIFIDEKGNSRGQYLFLSGGNSTSNISWNRMKRKFKMRILESIAHNKNTQFEYRKPFVWATGGHSATAAHGNFYDESYTAILENDLKPIFDIALGIPFIGRNYAMGGTSAAPEIASCQKEIFGSDIDILIWDYGMTDGPDIWKQSLYYSRSGLNRGRPVNIAFHAGGRNYRGRMTAISEMENLGLASFISSEDVMQAAFDNVPDSFGFSETQIEALPKYVRDLKCQNQIENGDPYCKAHKFNLTVCENRKGKTNWHPGWKWHALMGHLASFFVLDVLHDALQELDTTTYEQNDPMTLLRELKRQEDADYAKFWAAPVMLERMINAIPPKERDNAKDLDLELIVKGHNFCHTARTPAEIRHKGILTMSSQKGFWNYDTGIGLKKAKAQQSTTPGSEMRLTYTESDRVPCAVPQMIDYKDYFFVSSTVGEKLILPNPAEVKEYGTGVKLQGQIMMCFTLCPWGKCPSGVLAREDFFDGKYQFRVNGINVLNFTKFGDCEMLKHTKGYKFGPHANNTFEIEARITDKAPSGSFLRIGAFVIW